MRVVFVLFFAYFLVPRAFAVERSVGYWNADSSVCGSLLRDFYFGTTVLPAGINTLRKQVVEEISALAPGSQEFSALLKTKIVRATFFVAFQSSIRILNDAHEALDVSQNTMLRVLDLLESGRISITGEHHLLALTRQISRRRSLDILRKRGTANTKFGGLDVSDHSSIHPVNHSRRWTIEALKDRDVPARQPERQDRLFRFLVSSLIEEAFLGLEKQLRQIIELRLLSGMLSDDVASQLKISSRSVERKYASGIAKLRDYLVRNLPNGWPRSLEFDLRGHLESASGEER
jgi:RNA polymerase sigma factor (sigma-70 family)